MSVYSALMVDELLVGYQYNTLPITKDELIEILFEKCDGDDRETQWLLESMETQLTDSEKENRRLRQDIHELEQKIEDIRRIL